MSRSHLWGLQFLLSCSTNLSSCTLDSWKLLMEEILHWLIGSLSHSLQGFYHPRWLAGFLPSTASLKLCKRLVPWRFTQKNSPSPHKEYPIAYHLEGGGSLPRCVQRTEVATLDQQPKFPPWLPPHQQCWINGHVPIPTSIFPNKKIPQKENCRQVSTPGPTKTGGRKKQVCHGHFLCAGLKDVDIDSLLSWGEVHPLERYKMVYIHVYI